MYLVNFLDGPLKGMHFLPELKHYWYFKLSSGKSNQDHVILYWMVSKSKQVDATKVANNSPKVKKSQERKIQATYRYNHRWKSDINHQDVKQFVEWHEKKYGRKPESLYSI